MAIVDIKGQNGGLVFVFGKGTVDEYISFLKSRLDSNPQMFQGFSVAFRGEGLKNIAFEDMVTLQRLCLDYGMALALPPVSKAPKEKPGEDMVIRKTLRSGQKVISDGSIVIWGDVHESAEVVAGKDIIVMGRLEGMAHAGCFGDLSSVIFALSLYPRQVRIGNKISRPPSDYERNAWPEMACIEDDEICIKEYRLSNPIRKASR